MAVKIKSTKKFIKLVDRVTKSYTKAMAEKLPELVLDEISLGKSPKRGGIWRKPYADSYKKKIRKGRGVFASKRVTPVNLELTGDMLKSLSVTEMDLKKGTFILSFDSELASIHSFEGVPRNAKGEGQDVAIREMLPSKGKGFNRRISKFIKSTIEKVTAAVVRRL